ncbi:uncharacterized protein K02A2.6-like [Corticium candelabrum]|uniref:uncharacterized protein K02A2.6-like n=1 Tax=Corticium candelabrum TaxID=121492 RepID=UPI002E26879D|nr:uncharacterized protein K02A2.6-like [Corticium candelabrum]
MVPQKLVTAAQLRRWTEQDITVAKVRSYTLSGSPRTNSEATLEPYWRRRVELCVLGGCVLWGSQVIIPPQARKKVLEELHACHPGAARMKGLARSYVWWPKMDQEIEQHVKLCIRCQSHATAPAKAPLHPWACPEKPWTRLHLDFAGPFMGRQFLVVVDAFTKWPEVEVLPSITALSTIKSLQRIFATHGIREMCVSDNRPAIVSKEFKQFMEGNGITHITSAPYHPSTNGQAERAVETFKSALRKMRKEYKSLESKVDRFLFRYRLTPHTTTGELPAVLLVGRLPCSRLDILRPDVGERTRQRQEQQRYQHDRTSRERNLGIGQPVFLKDFGAGELWVTGTVEEQTGPMSYTVHLPDGRIVRDT